ncbi:hypothetical protein ANN_02911 [Periplaneta americana]|uniref:Uncharacterized protein n=1 Tax=Periplaneta americana TaxID=6978 RepID=A0ABQ8TXM3_PERAM|nr:hypothetical protein ANN_02911 [Periplaneta americana]
MAGLCESCNEPPGSLNPLAPRGMLGARVTQRADCGFMIKLTVDSYQLRRGLPTPVESDGIPGSVTFYFGIQR